MVFGNIRGVTFFEMGIIVTDDLATSVTAFTLDGSLIWSLHSKGDGPRDLRVPLSTSAVGRRVYIGERRGVKVFDLDSAHQPQYRAMAAVAAPPYGQCVSRRDVVLQSWDPTTGFLAQRLDADLRPTGTGYARLEVSGPSVGPSQLGFAYAEGLVACLSDGAVVVAPRTSISEIRAFEPDGRLRWRVRLENYRPLTTQRVPGGFTTLPPENGYHRIESVTPLDDGQVLVQVALMSLEALAAGSYIELRSLIFDGRSGHLLETDTSLPPIVAAGVGCVASRPPGAIPVVEVLCPPR